MSKIYIGIITGNEKDNIWELTSIAHNFDGLAAVDHFSTDGTFEILEQRKGNGFVERIPYYGNHSHSMNHFLFHPKIEMGHWVLLRDSSERINPIFARNIKNFISYLEDNGINTVYQYSKVLLFRRYPWQFFASTPHWGLQNARGNALKIEESGIFEKDEDYCYSVRNQKRDQFHFVKAYLRYYLMLDSNHLALDEREALTAGLSRELRENTRISFLRYLQSEGVKLDADTVIEYMKSENLSQKAKDFINSELILNNTYRYYILNDTSFKDNHDHKDLIKI